MGCRIVEMSQDPRKEQFTYFRSLANPYVGVTVELDVTELAAWSGQTGTSFFLAVLYAAVRAANSVPELRRRIRGEQVVTAAPPLTPWHCQTGHTAIAVSGRTRHLRSFYPMRLRSRNGPSMPRLWRKGMRRIRFSYLVSRGSPIRR